MRFIKSVTLFILIAVLASSCSLRHSHWIEDCNGNRTTNTISHMHFSENPEAHTLQNEKHVGCATTTTAAIPSTSSAASPSTTSPATPASTSSFTTLPASTSTIPADIPPQSPTSAPPAVTSTTQQTTSTSTSS